jgi:competence protein ComEC
MPLLWLSLAFLAGILLAAYLSLTTSTWLLLAGGILLLLLSLSVIRRSHPGHAVELLILQPPGIPIPLPVLLLVIFLGAARYQGQLPNLTSPDFIAFYNDNEKELVITGRLTQPPDLRDTYASLRVRAERLRSSDSLSYAEVQGLLLARVTPESASDLHYGDRVVLRGTLETPPEDEDFSYRDYLARQGVYSYLPRARVALLEPNQGNFLLGAIYWLKERALHLVYRLWPDPEASLLAGILLGVETGIPESVQQAFKDTGTSHIIAISGFNITILAGLLATLFGRLLNPRQGAIAALLGIALYTILVGTDAAVVRAAIMGGLSLFARQVGRRQHGLNTLAFTAALMALINPLVPWDVGFQLSFAATLGLVLYAEPLTQAFINLLSRHTSADTAKRLAGPVGEYFLFTLAAQITTLPITAYHFHRLSLIAFLANPVILPAQPPIMILGGLALFLGLIWHPLGQLTAPLAWPFILFTIRAVEFFGQFRAGVLILGQIGLLSVVLFYGLLLTGTFAGQPARKWLPTLKPVPSLFALGMATVIVWRLGLTAPDGRLHLTLLDVGTGDALLLQSPSGRYILINGGPSTSRLSDGLGRRLPPFNHRLDWLIVASPRQEQIAALPRVLERFPPGNVLWSGLTSPSRAADYLREFLSETQIPVTSAQPGRVLDLGEGAQLVVLTVGKRGAILLLEWNHFRALLPLGANSDDLQSLHLGRDVGPVTVLLLADNGYAALNPPEWIANLHPQLVLLSVAADDRNGLPNRETLDILGGYSLLRSDQNGWIHLATDGKQMWVEVERVTR